MVDVDLVPRTGHLARLTPFQPALKRGSAFAGGDAQGKMLNMDLQTTHDNQLYRHPVPSSYVTH